MGVIKGDTRSLHILISEILCPAAKGVGAGSGRCRAARRCRPHGSDMKGHDLP